VCCFGLASVCPGLTALKFVTILAYAIQARIVADEDTTFRRDFKQEHTPLRTETIRHSGERNRQSEEQIASVYDTEARFIGISPRNDLRIASVIYDQYVNEEQQQVPAEICGIGE
jgi:hypothetical protein